MTTSADPKCTHRRQLALVVLSVPLLFAAWTWIGVVAYQRWGDQPTDLTQPDELAFAAVGVLVYVASWQAVRLLLAKAKQVREQQNTCRECQ